MKKFIKSILNIFVLSIIFSFISCTNSLEYDSFDSSYKNILDSTQNIKNNAKKLIEGVYSVTKGNTQFGDIVVIKLDEKYLSVFCGKNEAFMITLGGVDKDTNFSFEGYWRYAQTEQRGKVSFKIAKNDGALSTLNGLKPNKIIINGRIDGNKLIPSSDLQLTYLRPLYNSKDDFYIVGHRGGGRNSDLHPFSENSIQMINFASALGSNGVEIDIRLTKDKVPVLYHDENLNQRLTKSPLLVGPIKNYTYDQLLKFGQLVRGEEIPTLEQVLKFIVSKQSINFVWLDVKIPEEVDTVIALQKRFQDSANKIGRKLIILFGLPDEDVFNTYINSKFRDTLSNSVCELDLNKVEQVNSYAWAPRWTLGTLNSEVNQVHSKNRKAIVWTLDQTDFIVKFLKEGNFDGILTNYPMTVAYNYYTKINQ